MMDLFTLVPIYIMGVLCLDFTLSKLEKKIASSLVDPRQRDLAQPMSVRFFSISTIFYHSDNEKSKKSTPIISTENFLIV